MKDLTKIKTPFGLLKPNVQGRMEAHRAANGLIEIYISGKWEDTKPDWFHDQFIYRAKPADHPPAFCAESLVNLSGVVASQREHLEVIAAAPAIFAAVKEWQDAISGGHISTDQTCDAIGVKAHRALMAIKVPS